MKYIALLILLGIAIQNNAEAGLPSYIIPCEASDENCLKNTLQALEPHLVQGIKEFHLPSIVPLRVPDFNHTTNISSDTDYFFAFTNAELGQVNNYKVSNFSIDLNHLKFLLVLSFPQVTLTANEEASGKAFGLEVNWNGIGGMNFKNLTINLQLDGTQILKGGKRHVNWRKNKVNISTDLISYNIEAFLGDKQLRRALLQKVDQNLDFSNREARFIVENTLAEYIFRVINVVHDTFPIDVLYANQ